jgi:hypothetical protein
MAGKTERYIKAKIEEDLIEQLTDKKATQEYYVDLVRDYIFLWDTKNKLKADIKSRGVSIFYVSREGQEGYKKNDSIAEIVKVNNQMLKILSDLELKTTNLKVVEKDEEL